MKCCLRLLFVYLVAIGTAISSVALCQAQTSAQRVANGLSDPLYGTFAPGDSSRLFVVEQGSGGTARIKILDLNTNSVLGTPFLTITGMDTSANEEGLLGLAFHPDYANNGHFYINGTFPGSQTRIRRYTVSGNPNIANASSAAEIMSFSQPFSNHNGGWIGFDPTSSDSYLYIGTGDGGSGDDPLNNAQDITNNRLGKMLRIEPSVAAGGGYSVPASNPFVGVTGDDEIWAYGLRNPWRNSFDRTTGDFWIGDVGQNAREEINFQPAGSTGGENYGWRVKEGLNCADNSQAGGNPPCNFAGFTDPIHTYPHTFNTTGGFSLTGGYVYHGSVAQYEGLYFFADYVTENIWTLDPLANNPSATVINRNTELQTNIGGFNGIPSFAEDADGELYILSFSGEVFRIESTARDAVWNGNDAGAGTSGDGTSWSDANNWTRGGTVDSIAVSKDRVIFAAGSSNPNINVQSTRIVGAMEFQADYTLSGGALTVLSGNISVNSGVAATINSSLAAESVISSLRKRGAGRLNVNGTAGQMVVLEGTLGGTGTLDSIRVFAGAKVSPGLSIGTLNAGSYEMPAGSTLEIEVATTAADLLAVSGAATIAGTLEVLGAAYNPTVRGTIDEFMVITASSISGTFDNVTYDGTAVVPGPQHTHVDDGLFTNVIYNPNDVTLFNYFALLGDANGDQVVDFLDFNIWAANRFQTGKTWTEGDFNGDGTTDFLDFNLWAANRFTSVPRPVPEPASCIVLLMGLAMFALRRYHLNI